MEEDEEVEEGSEEDEEEAGLSIFSGDNGDEGKNDDKVEGDDADR